MYKCDYCGKEFNPSSYQLKQLKINKPIYCCTSCSTGARYNVKITNEIIEIIKDKVYNSTLSLDKIQKQSGLSKEKFKEVLSLYNIKRSKDIVNKIRKENMIKTVQEKYGVTNVMELQEFRDKARLGNVNKTEQQKQQIINKRNETKLAKYGDVNYNNRKQAHNTMKDRYGVETNLQRQDVQNKIKEVVLEKYGVDNAFKSEQVHKLAKQKMQELYGVDYGLQSENIRQKVNETNIKRYGYTNPFSNKEIQQKQNTTMLQKYGVKYGCETPNCIESNNTFITKINKDFANLVNITDLQYLEYLLNPYRYDLKYNETNILFEINPTVTHNCYKNIYGGQPKDINYHLNKTLKAMENGYKCIHVFDWDDWYKIKYLVQEKETLYARQLELKEVSIEETSEFLNSYHLQNTCKGQTIRLGLYKDNKLIELMTFGKPRYNKNYEYELLRLCTHKDYKVVGGAEKLFKHFIDKYNPTNIISYCDFSKFTGEVYERLGFIQKGKPTPTKHWSKGSNQITDNLLRQRGYDQLFNTNYGKGTNNEELMLQNGWLPICDCGQLVFSWTKDVK